MRPLPLSGDMEFLGSELRAGRQTALSLWEACARQTDVWDAQVRAFVERVQSVERTGERRGPQEDSGIPPLLDMPVGVKDVFDVAGYPTRAGCAALTDMPPARSHATAVAALIDAGARVAGKLSTHELAAGVVTPQSRNPRDLSRMAGGSSGGSAVAVACGMVMGALGTDTGGSTRIPAAFCGVVGFKPTYGAISRRGILPRGPQLDTVGLLGKSAADAALLYTALERPSHRKKLTSGVARPDAPASHPAFLEPITPLAQTEPLSAWHGVAIGIPEEWLQGALQNAVELAFQNALRGLAALGARVLPVRLPTLELGASIRERVLLFSFARHYRSRYQAFPQGFSPDVARQIERGSSLSRTDHLAGLRDMRQFAGHIAQVFSTVDLIVSPTVPVTAPPCDSTVVRAGSLTLSVMDGLTRFTSPWNLSRIPAISLPLHGGRLPVGLQLAAPQGADRWLLKLAIAAEEAGVTLPAQAFPLSLPGKSRREVRH